MCILHDKITLKCLRCHQCFNVTVGDFGKGKCRRCPTCGGEMNKSAFGEWVKQNSETILKNMADWRDKNSN
jgi:hypothetical protein